MKEGYKTLLVKVALILILHINMSFNICRVLISSMWAQYQADNYQSNPPPEGEQDFFRFRGPLISLVS